jgi:choline dehydrogenase-like flavoprotein
MIGTCEIWAQDNDTCHLNGTDRTGDDTRSNLVNADCLSGDIRNLWIRNGSVFRAASVPASLSGISALQS